MGNLQIQKNIHAVENYLASEFPNLQVSIVSERVYSHGGDYLFYIENGKGETVYRMQVSSEFLNDYNVTIIKTYLHQYNVAALLRETESQMITLKTGGPYVISRL